jgi:hypothetical protein
MQLLLNNGIFYEFIPFTDDNFDEDGKMVENPETLMIDEVENNTDYALLITTVSGAWRYLIGDTVRFTDKEQAEMIITGRTKHFLSLCGEHLSVDNMNQAILDVSSKMSFDLKEFTVNGAKHDGLFAHHWYVGTEQQVDEIELRDLLDQRLKELNDDYAVERTAALKDIKVKVINPSIFMEYMEEKGKIGGQNKFPRVMKGEKMNDWLHFLEKRELSL